MAKGHGISTPSAGLSNSVRVIGIARAPGQNQTPALVCRVNRVSLPETVRLITALLSKQCYG
ncbi:hypothetical protein R69888_02938 [Paraburkholderia haematera]|uniref:LysR family transcriptional regulator n=1 Tax=Paraburkholderia haematera TaxID=2793077 RepID=A0ABM8RFT8_9BURK|nr:hypothetical protein R69888_02938 [Paraburkholderia haematera]